MTLPHSSRLAGLKDYVSQREIRLSLPSRRAATPGEDTHTPGGSMIQSWSHWASQKIRRNTKDVATIDEVQLFPSWATKQLHRPSPGEPASTFDVVFHVSGFATSRRTPEFHTRSQRAFLKLARNFVALPKPQPPLYPTDTELQYFSERLHLPPRPDEISDDYEVEYLDAHFRNSGHRNQEIDDDHYTQSTPANTIPAELARLHENLESRLKLFWASSLSSRRIQVTVFPQSPDHKRHPHSLEFRPFLTREMLTGPDGHFSGTFRINWNDICTNPVGTHIASNQTHVEHELLVEARIINTEDTPELHETPPLSIIHIPITHSIVRVISDIDDTVKVSRVVDGARAIFNQVFVKDLEDTVIPEMGEWYGKMWERGVRFHYVSNSPFELLPVINQFISISKLPLGSIRLRSYAGRSLFNGLLSASATRKKGNVVEVLDQFPDSQFLLVGDSGEQDLELYSSLAAERPDQIAGIFIRDVSAVGLEDPTGTKTDFGLTNSPMKLWSRGTLPFPSNIPPRSIPKRAASDTDVSPAHPGAIHIPQPTRRGTCPLHHFRSNLYPIRISCPECRRTRRVPSPRQVRPITEGEKKRWDLQHRVNKARLLMPSHIVLRVFENPKECVEAEQIIQRLMDVN
ncbi:hypothetical protein J3R82DRAFT_8494 [Butyriboletus roseoflavus]|nr:hypothetical protein J3R82DRAFT_8494 [Butyriboletus roseoflavus]